MSVQKMSVDEWIAVKDNPIQRDTERHAAKAMHLMTPHPVHAVVWAARLPSGQLIKLDGHTRALLWKRNQVERPRNIEVHLMDVTSLEEAAEIYKTFDSKDALETTPDKISGALRGMNYKPESPLIASGAFASALRMAWSAVYGYGRDVKAKDIYESINEFAVELIALDELKLRRGQLPTGGMVAVMLSFRKHGDGVIPFWRSVMSNSGTKAHGRMDGVQAAVECLLARKNGSKAGMNADLDLAGRLLACIETWLLKEDFSTHRPRPLELLSYLDQKSRKPKFKLVRRGHPNNPFRNEPASAAKVAAA